jgi:dTDP-glucose pyrophosphorylase
MERDTSCLPEVLCGDVCGLKPSWRNEMEIPDAISLLIDSEYKVTPHHVDG